MFKNAKIGDKVWSITNGNGEIVNIYSESVFPILVTFHNSSYCYTYDGKLYRGDINPSLFWNEFEIPKQVKQEVKIDSFRKFIESKNINWNTFLINCRPENQRFVISSNYYMYPEWEFSNNPIVFLDNVFNWEYNILNLTNDELDTINNEWHTIAKLKSHINFL